MRSYHNLSNCRTRHIGDPCCSISYLSALCVCVPRIRIPFQARSQRSLCRGYQLRSGHSVVECFVPGWNLISFTHARGYSPKWNGAAERIAGVVGAIGRRMLVSATLDAIFWSWAVEYASGMVRVNALKPQARIIPFGYRVVVELFPNGRKRWGLQCTGGRDAEGKSMVRSRQAIGGAFRANTPVSVLKEPETPTAAEQVRPARPHAARFGCTRASRWTWWTAPAQLATTDTAAVVHSLEPVEERRAECEAQATIALVQTKRTNLT